MRNAGSDAIESTLDGPQAGHVTLGSRMVALARAAAALHMARLAQGDWTPVPDPLDRHAPSRPVSVLGRRRAMHRHARRGAGL